MLMTAEGKIFLLVRELANGTWFMLSAFLAMGFMFYIFANIRSHRTWNTYQAAAVSTAGAMTVWFVGSGLRAGIMWLQWLHAPPGTVPIPWISSTDFYILSTLLGLIGAAWLLAVFADWKVWVLVTLAAIGVPVLLHIVRTQAGFEASSFFFNVVSPPMWTASKVGMVMLAVHPSTFANTNSCLARV